MAKFKGKYRSESTRLQNWDYAWNAAYFLTICTHQRTHYFGEIKNNKMHLSPTGVLADVFWHEIKHHAKNVKLDAFVVMPNHIHGILILNNSDVTTMMVDARHALHLPSSSPSPDVPDKTIGQKRFQNQGKNSISSIIGGYKSAVTKHANRLGFNFAWQSRFYDHIIRNDASFNRIKNYIINNPRNWKEDKFNPIHAKD